MFVCSVQWHIFSITRQEAFRCGWPDCKTSLHPHQNNSKWHNHVCYDSKTWGKTWVFKLFFCLGSTRGQGWLSCSILNSTNLKCLSTCLFIMKSNSRGGAPVRHILGRWSFFSRGIILSIFKCVYITLDYTLINRSRSDDMSHVSWFSLYELTMWQTQLPLWDCLGVHFWEIKVSKKAQRTATVCFCLLSGSPFSLKASFSKGYSNMFLKQLD